LKRLFSIVSVIAMLAGLAGCGNAMIPAGSIDPGRTVPVPTTAVPVNEYPLRDPQPEQNAVVTIEMADGGIIKMELYYDIAPNTVANMVSLVKEGYYDGVIFHRVIPGFMIQGGDPEGTGGGGPGYGIPGEFDDNGFSNKLEHLRGVVSMARRSDPNTNSAGSQFFICVADARSSLDGGYAAFGKVIEGMDVADKIVSAERDTDKDSPTLDRPFAEQKMKKVTVETFGFDYPDPITCSETDTRDYSAFVD